MYRLRLQTLLASLLAAGSFVAAPAALALPPECPLLLPDFRCARHGRYEGFVPPMMHPYLFEDPFITTGLSAWGLWHEFPDQSILDSGHLWDAAVQARVAITDRVGFVASKDGYVRFSPGLDLLDDETGMTDLMAGLKVAVVDEPEIPLIVSTGLRLQLTNGSSDILQGNGEGILIPDVSAAWGWGNLHLIGDFGAEIPFDGDANSSFLFYHLHLDYAVLAWLVPFVELGGFSYVDDGSGKTKIELEDGTRVPLGAAFGLLGHSPEEGLDYANLGIPGVDGHDVLTWAVGVRVPVNRHVILGAAYQLPLTERRDLLSQRATLNLTVEL